MKTIEIKEFFDSDYVSLASYDNLRKIASVIDGQKNAARKVLSTVLDKNITTKLKVSQLGPRAAEHTEYLHGGLDGVIVNLATKFPGTNNIPLLEASGNFGTRFDHEAAASRYIYTNGSKDFFKLFKKDDISHLKYQTFEGSRIEPVYFTPTLPLILINGSEGISFGFSQKILPRDPKEIIEYIKKYIKNKKCNFELLPYYNGYKGSVNRVDVNSYEILGKITRISATKIMIEEVPVNYTINGYLAELNKLEDAKIIKNYKDMSEDDNFKFELSVTAEFSKKSDHEILNALKLVRRVTENLTCVDENNKIVIFENVFELLNYYIDFKLKTLGIRKENLIKEFSQKIALDESQYKFIELVINDKIVIYKRKRDDIINDIKKYPDIIEHDNYNYLLNLPLLSLTDERLKRIEKSLQESRASFEKLKGQSAEDLWLEDIKDLNI